MAKVTKTYTKEHLMNTLGLPHESTCVLRDKAIDKSRWTETRELVFTEDGKNWLTYYESGLTESQELSPWVYENEIKCLQVELREVTTKEWIVVDDGS